MRGRARKICAQPPVEHSYDDNINLTPRNRVRSRVLLTLPVVAAAGSISRSRHGGPRASRARSAAARGAARSLGADIVAQRILQSVLPVRTARGPAGSGNRFARVRAAAINADEAVDLTGSASGVCRASHSSSLVPRAIQEAA
jgi:hypothetical protein